MTAFLLSAALAVGVGIPESCKARMERLDYWTLSHAQAVGRPLRTLVVPSWTAETPNDVAWTRPFSTLPGHKNTIWFRVDFLCVSSDSVIELTLSHETFHLVNSRMSHEEIEDAIRLAVGQASYAAYRAELETAVERMEEWHVRRD
jgi:hypothetical protein